jgi:hypothetical protein
MAVIENDQDLRVELGRLSPGQQRRIGGLFIENALDLCDDPRIRRAIQVAKDLDASDVERKDAYHAAKSLAVSTYTECGRNTDWARQATHFVAAAAACLLSNEGHGDDENRAWKVAMQLRNARNCALIAQEGQGDDEAESQRRLAAELVGG